MIRAFANLIIQCWISKVAIVGQGISPKDLYAFLLMIIVLMIKPTGFFGVQVKMKA